MAWVTASTSIVKLEVETVEAALFSWMALTGIWLQSHQCTHYEVLRYAVFLNEKLDL